MDAMGGDDLGAAEKDKGSAHEEDELDARGMKRKRDLIMREDIPMITKHDDIEGDVDEVDKKGFIMSLFGSLRGKPTTSPGKNKFVYKMNREHRGYFIIINNKTFTEDTRMSERRGTDVDAENLQKQFDELGFKVCRFDNQTCKQMQRLMNEAASIDHRDADCFACAILSHGDNNDIIYGTDNILNLKNLVAPFKGDTCPSLVGKPKLFFIQACRGDRLDNGAPIEHEVDLGTEQKIPVEADFLFAYSTVPGYYSWRNSVAGSWFVQSLCKALENYGHLELMHILTRTNYYVAYEYESNSSRVYMNHKKQMSSIVSMLTKELYFV